jgi:hypothetical protein
LQYPLSPWLPPPPLRDYAVLMFLRVMVERPELARQRINDDQMNPKLRARETEEEIVSLEALREVEVN